MSNGGLVHKIAADALCLVHIDRRAAANLAGIVGIQIADRFLVDFQTVELLAFFLFRHDVSPLFFWVLVQLRLHATFDFAALFPPPFDKAELATENYHRPENFFLSG
ncbi:MAG: hypothetical protein ACREAB_02990 [Blastocatellia bacterium]